MAVEWVALSAGQKAMKNTAPLHEFKGGAKGSKRKFRFGNNLKFKNFLQEIRNIRIIWVIASTDH